MMEKLPAHQSKKETLATVPASSVQLVNVDHEKCGEVRKCYSRALTDEALAGVERVDLLLPRNRKKFEETHKTFHVGNSSVLSKVKTFLPQMALAQKELDNDENQDNFDIENLDGYAGPVIEMDVGLFSYSSENENCASSSTESDTDDNEDVDGKDKIKTNLCSDDDNVAGDMCSTIKHLPN